ncbi:ATP-binding protein [Nocardioides sp. SOB77]|uniref:histidine kinase n=1 Tax=Nocardioides oceani TaxID=3058369 RepID=A0ABT8FHK9_9ACTN|nr:ATP-binding protein [Nocardioides oceani]MDN4174089.1 ATP-binding protein [Nocardioides oceani]
MEPSRGFSFSVPVGRLESASHLAALRESGLTELRTDPVLDRLTRLAGQSTGAPVALVTVVEPTRQVFASAQGLAGALEEARQTPLSHSFCQYVVANDAPLVVTDARTHPELARHPGVLENDVIAYAGHPVRHPDGTVIGTICVADPAPHDWTPGDLLALADLAEILEADIAHRVRRAAAERLQHGVQGAVRGAMDNTSTAIIAADRHGIVTFVNRGAGSLLGLDPGLLTDLHLDDLTHAWHPVSGRGTPDGAEDWLLTDATGEQRVVSVRRTTVRADDGTETGTMLICDDVSARHRAEKLLKDALHKQEAIVEQMKVLDRARHEFIATASHELRTPVANIIGYTELLADGEGGPMTDRQHSLLDRVSRNSQRLLELVANLLTLSQINANEYTPAWRTVDVAEAARQAWESLGPRLVGRELAMHLDLPSRPASVRGDAVEIERIIENLLTNATKYTPDGEGITLSVRRASGGVQVVVRDTGIGIGRDEQERVFEPFFRAHEAQQRAIQGSGLGLTLVQQLTRAHGGTVELVSAPGVGTTVTVSLPVDS